MEPGVKKISCLIYSQKGWIILKDKKFVGYIRKMEDGDYKYQYQTHSEYGPCGYTNSVDSAIEEMVASEYY